MRHHTVSPSSCAAAAGADDEMLSHSALQATRAAIARWSGSASRPGAPARDVPRVSPQARWLAEAQCGLAAWIAHGGFAQADETASAMSPLHTHRCDVAAPDIQDSLNACVD
jgi:hypothetical protein